MARFYSKRNVSFRKACVLACLGIFAAGCGSSSAPVSSTETRPAEDHAKDPGRVDAKLSSFAQEIRTRSDVTKLSLKVGQRITLPVTVRNMGSQPWSSAGGAPINFSFRWLLGSQDTMIEPARTPLNELLPPGGSASLDPNIVAPSTPGDYTLRLSMVQEGIAWFFNSGGQPLDIPVQVR
jgi:hypothetical protein